MWALIRKETLENVRWLPLALLLTSSLTLSAVSSGWLDDISPLLWNTMYGSSLLALGFGLLQSIPDNRNAARAYLLHRGVSAAQAFWAKTLVGFAMAFISICIPLVLCAVWLSMRGVLNAPGRWIQVLPPAAIALTGFLFHPTVLLIINRPAKWLGSRILPICVPIFALMYCQSTLGGVVNAKDVWTVVVVSLAGLAVLVLAARCAYVDLARLPAASSKAYRHPAVMLIMVASMLSAVAIAAVAIFTVDQAFRVPVGAYYVTILNRNDRQLWLVRVEERWNKEKNEIEAIFLNGSPLTDSRTPDVSGSVPADFVTEDSVQLYSLLVQERYGARDIAYRSLNGSVNSQRWNALVDRRGYILCYERSHLRGDRLGQVISRDGIRDPKSDWGQPFEDVFAMADYRQLRLGLMGDRNGIYQIDESKGTVWRLIEHPTSQAALSSAPGTPLRLFVRSSSELLVYELSDDAGAITVPKELGRLAVQGQLAASLIAEVELPQLLAQLPTWHVYYRSADDWVVHGSGGVGSYSVGSVVRKNPGQQQPVTFTPAAPPETYIFSMRDVRFASLLSNPVPSLLTPFFSYLTAGRHQHKSLAEVSSVPAKSLPGVVVTFLLQGLVAAVLAWFMAERRGVSLRVKWIWSALGIALGWAIPLAVLACYPRIVRETCTHCQRPRRIDLERCEHCNATWEKAQREGIEIIEHEFDEARQVDASPSQA